jgi:Tol biopolymer transport system component
VGFRGRYAFVAVLASLILAAPAWATFPGASGKIAFNRLAEQDDQFVVDLFSVDPDGSHLFQLTTFGFDTFSEYPDHSPDGRTIAFQKAEPDSVQIWLTDADGTHPRQLTDFPNGAFDPAFSPDGRTLAVDTDIDGSPGIFLIPAHTRGSRLIAPEQARRVTRVTDGGFDSEPQMSPDGKWIVFTRYSVECTDDTIEDCQTRIFRVRTNGKHLEQLTPPELNSSAPDYHPSGRWIAVDTSDSIFAPNVGHILIMRADGSGKRIIVRGDADSFNNNPSFSPGGTRISYAHWPLLPDGTADTSEIWTARTDGTKPRRITHSAIRDNKPDWGPAVRRHRHMR